MHDFTDEFFIDKTPITKSDLEAIYKNIQEVRGIIFNIDNRLKIVENNIKNEVEYE